MAIKGKEIINEVDVNKMEGYITINFSPNQWKEINKKKLKVTDVKSNIEKIYVDKEGNKKLDINVQSGTKTINVKVVGEEDIQDFIDLFDSVDRVYGEISYEVKYMKGRIYKDLELKKYDVGETIKSKSSGESALDDMM